MIFARYYGKNGLLKMKKSLPVVFVCSLVCVMLLSSCADSFFMMDMEEKVQGNWKIDEVIWDEDGKLRTEDVSSDHQGLFFDFRSNQTLDYYDEERDLLLQGNWNITSECVGAGDNSETVYYLDILIRDEETGEDLSLYTEDLWVTKRKMTFVVYATNGHYCYTLTRIEDWTANNNRPGLGGDK